MFSTGVVGQEPVLFGYTIEENIKLGREGITKVKKYYFYFELKTYKFYCFVFRKK